MSLKSRRLFTSSGAIRYIKTCIIKPINEEINLKKKKFAPLQYLLWLKRVITENISWFVYDESKLLLADNFCQLTSINRMLTLSYLLYTTSADIKLLLCPIAIEFVSLTFKSFINVIRNDRFSSGDFAKAIKKETPDPKSRRLSSGWGFYVIIISECRKTDRKTRPIQYVGCLCEKWRF